MLSFVHRMMVGSFVELCIHLVYKSCILLSVVWLNENCMKKHVNFVKCSLDEFSRNRLKKSCLALPRRSPDESPSLQGPSSD